MASGDLLLTLNPINRNGPATNGAQPDYIPGASTPGELFMVIDFDASLIEYADWTNLVMPEHYSGGGITVTFEWASASVAGGTDEVRWEAAFRNKPEDAEDLDTTAHTYVYTGVEDPPPSAIGETRHSEMNMADGAAMDNVGAGDFFAFRVRRNVSDPDDTMTGDAQLLTIKIVEQ